MKPAIKRVPKSTFPNLITLLNLFMGFWAVTEAFRGEIIGAVWTVYFATFLDLVDGRLAKALGATSPFGAEFDSLADVMAFGVAPAVILYNAYFADWEFYGVLLGFMPLGFSAMRLARFNVAGKAKYFQGIPTPISAQLLVGFVGFAYTIWDSYEYPVMASVLAVIVSFLMVSKIPFDSNVIDNPRSFAQTWKLIPFFLSILSVALFGIIAIFPWAAIYVVIGLLRWLVAHFSPVSAAPIAIL